jgi:hypothetical protein
MGSLSRENRMFKYDREELYQKVWEHPMLKVAQEYGVSSVALGKTCKKLSVPVPGRGHWAKLAHGHSGTNKPPLPKLEKVPVIYRSPIAEKKPTDSDQSDPEFISISQLLVSGALSPPKIDLISRPHPLVKAILSRLRNQNRKDHSDIQFPLEPGDLEIKVSKGILDRALYVMAQIIEVLERQNYGVFISDEGNTVASINGEQIRFAIEEPFRKVVTAKPRVANPTDRWDYEEAVTHEPGGKLVLTILAATWGRYEQRKRWSDAKTQQVESLVADFVAGLLRTAVSLRLQREEHKQQEVERERREEERWKLRQDIQEEEKRVQQLDQWVDGWERADRIRSFIRAYEEKSRSWPSEDQAGHRGWIKWASEQADRIDPLVSEKPVSVLDRKRELNWW